MKCQIVGIMLPLRQTILIIKRCTRNSNNIISFNKPVNILETMKMRIVVTDKCISYLPIPQIG